MELSELSADVMERAKQCKSIEELAALAEKSGVELSDEQLDAFSGGVDWDCAGKCYDLQCDTHCVSDFNPYTPTYPGM